MIQVCQWRLERIVLRVSLKDRIHKVDLRRTTGMKDASDIVGGLKWQWGRPWRECKEPSGRTGQRCGTPESARDTSGGRRPGACFIKV
ncbi:hypothetical protein C0J52_23877 [Blattella germanica]|nr:hypothetical protein C0J52_23877 [Blattella germanica]